METIVTGLLSPVFRKLVALLIGGWMAILVEKTIVTQIQVDTVIQFIVAVLGFALIALWTWAKNKLTAKTAITVPTVVVPEVVEAVEAKK